MSLRSPLARVRGLGSAKEGTEHWWSQRVTAVALVLLVLWFTISMLTLNHSNYDSVVAWMSRPFNSALLILTVITLFYHGYLGMQVVIEDYIHAEAAKITILMLTRFILFLLAAIAVVAILKVAFIGLIPAEQIGG